MVRFSQYVNDHWQALAYIHRLKDVNLPLSKEDIRLVVTICLKK